MKVTVTTQLETEDAEKVEIFMQQDDESLSAELRKLIQLGILKREEQND